jgi:hypothetical protein
MGDTKAIPLVVVGMADLEFIQLAMVKQEFTFRAQQHGRIVDLRSGPFRESRADVNPMASRRVRQLSERGAAGDRFGVGSSGIIGPSEIHGLGE